MSKKVLVLLHPGVEEIEAVVPVDILRRADLSVTTASTESTRQVRGRSGILLSADEHLHLIELNLGDYAAIVIPGGPGIKNLLGKRRVLECVRSFHRMEKWIAAICAAPLLLKSAGVLEGGEKLAGHPSIAGELSLEEGHPVVVDGPFITSPGAGTALPFALKITALLTDLPTAEGVARSICYPEQGLGADS